MTYVYVTFIYNGKTRTSCVGELKICLSFLLCSKLSQTGLLPCDESDKLFTNLCVFVFNIVNHSPKYKINKGRVECRLFKKVKLFFMNLLHN